MTAPFDAWVDGRRVAPGEAAVPASDLGLRQGVGVFETFRVASGRSAGLALHLARLVAGGRRLGLDVDEEAALTGLRALAADVAGDVVARITVTAGDGGGTWPSLASGGTRTIVTVQAAPPLPTGPSDATIVAGPRAPAGLADVKTTSYAGSVLATATARQRGAAIALMSEGDAITEAADGNLVTIRGGVLTTPPVDGRIIPGVTRALLLEVARAAELSVLESELTRTDLLAADLVLVTSAVRRLRPVRRVDMMDVGSDAAAAILADLDRRLDTLTAAAEPLAPLP